MTLENRNTINRLVVGSIPTEPRTCDVLTEYSVKTYWRYFWDQMANANSDYGIRLIASCLPCMIKEESAFLSKGNYHFGTDTLGCYKSWSGYSLSLTLGLSRLYTKINS